MPKDLWVDELVTENLNVNSSQPPGSATRNSFCLVVMTGPDKGAVHKLQSGDNSLGRSDRADITVSGRGISRIHAILHISEQGEIKLSDNDSTNGVFNQGRRLQSGKITVGDVFGLGPELRIRLESTDSGLHELIEEMYRSSKVDSLTNLLNRRAFEERMDEESSIAKRNGIFSCLAILDIDHFKSINDSHGHDAGDKVLRSLANLIESEARAGDLVARWGGEEFVVYIRQSEPQGAKILLNRLRESVSRDTTTLDSGQELSITFSAGLVYLKDFRDWRKALSQADEALYISKENGRNKITVVDSSDYAES